VLGIPVKVKILGFPKSFFVVALACGRAVDGMLIGLAMGTGQAGSGDHVGSLVGGVCWGPCACRRPDLFGSTDTAVWRHDEDGVPGVRAAEGCGPLSLFRSSTQTVATVSLRERAASIS